MVVILASTDRKLISHHVHRLAQSGGRNRRTRHPRAAMTSKSSQVPSLPPARPLGINSNRYLVTLVLGTELNSTDPLERCVHGSAMRSGDIVTAGRRGMLAWWVDSMSFHNPWHRLAADAQPVWLLCL